MGSDNPPYMRHKRGALRVIRENAADFQSAFDSQHRFVPRRRPVEFAVMHTGFTHKFGDGLSLSLGFRQHQRQGLPDIHDLPVGKQRLVLSHALQIGATLGDLLVGQQIDKTIEAVFQIAAKTLAVCPIAFRCHPRKTCQWPATLHQSCVETGRWNGNLVRVMHLAGGLIQSH